MRLARHDELVERMADAIALVGPYGTDKIRATAALDALLAAVVEMGVGVCGIDLSGLGGQRWRKPIDGETPDALILQLEENSHDE